MMGMYWAVIQPLVLMALYTFVFSVVLKVRLGGDGGVTSFAFFLFCGMLPWIAVSEGVTRSTRVVLDHVTLIKKVVFPSEILPVYVVTSALVMELIALGLFLLVSQLFYRPLGWSLVGLPLVLLLQFMFTLGLGWILASLNVFLRDVEQVLGLLMTLWMFLTPIFYTPDMLPRQVRLLVYLNPMATMVQSYRDLVLNHTWPAAAPLVVLGVVAMATFAIGHWFFHRSKKAFVDVM